MKYKKLLLDIDGTILDKQEKLSTNLQKALITASKKISISFCTGRDPEFTLDLANKLKLRSNHIVDDGSRVIDMYGKELWSVVLPQEVINFYLDLAKKHGFKIAATVSQRLKLELSKKDKHISRLFPYYLTQTQVNVLTSHLFSSDYEVKVVWFDETKGFNISITHIKGNKEHGIHFLLQHEGIKQAEVIGVGDGINDLPIFSKVGLKVAMENSPNEVRTNADIIVSSVEQNGVIEVLDKI